MTDRLADIPLRDPSGDLLDMAPSAKILADFLTDVPLPFTLGIYGAWGDGKTTFSHLLWHYLRQQPGWEDARRIEFSAWPFVTADAIWRALLDRIAREICQQPANELEPAEVASDLTLGSRFRRFLLTPALTLRREPGDPAREYYEQLVRRFDRSAILANRSLADTAANANLSALAGMVLEAAATLSPGVGPLRRLLGVGEGSVRELVAAGEVAAAPQVVQSVEEIRRELGRLFRGEVGQLSSNGTVPPRKLVILLDDLDRCLPEVALDVLETIKIFFFESAEAAARCLFLVAADEMLIGRGLRARIGVENLDAEDEARAYLEKIVQLGVPVPTRDATRIHRLVSASYSEWALTTDIVTAGLGSNPRRIKQQCNLLSFGYRTVGEIRTADAGTTLHAPEARILHKLVRSHSRSPTLLRCLTKLDGSPEQYMEQLIDHERYAELLQRSGEQRPPDDQPPFETDLARLLQGDATSRDVLIEPPLLSEMLSSPVWSDVKAALSTFWVLAAFADARPGPGGTPVTGDPIFPYVVQAVAGHRGTTTTQRLHLTYLQRLIALKEVLPDLYRELHAAAHSPNYVRLVMDLDRWLDEVEVKPEVADGPPAQLKAMAAACMPALRNDVHRTVLYVSPRLSQIPAEHVRTDVVSVNSIPPLTRQGTGLTTLLHKASLTAAALTDAAGQPRMDLNELDPPVRPRLQVARDLLERRKFVKLQMLEYGWAELGDRIRTPGGAQRLRDLERAVLDPDYGAKLPEWWRRRLDDERLVEFLRVPPYLREIFAEELEALAAPATHQAASSRPQPTPGDRDEERPVVIPYAGVRLALEPISDKGAVSEGEIAANVELGSLNSKVPTAAMVTLPVGSLLDKVRQLANAYLRGSPMTRDIGDPSSPEELLTAIGSELWTVLFDTSGLQKPLSDALEGSERVRLAITTANTQLMALPWECLYLPRFRVFAGQTLKLSVVRQVPERVDLVRRQIGRPLRILVIVANPKDAPLPGAGQEVEILQRTLEPAQRAGIVRLEVLEKATEDNVRHRLRVLQPHVLHFIGHGVVQDGTGALVLLGEDGRHHLLGARQMAVMLQDHGILLTVLNGCSTGVTEDQDLGRGVAQVLVQQGVPAAVATARPVLDDVALWFAGEFYRALADGYPLEAAVVEARKALSIKHWDWSAYVLYGTHGFPLDTLHI